jgi:hypothetical protein
MCTGVEIRNLAAAAGSAPGYVFRKIKDVPFQLQHTNFKQLVLVPKFREPGYQSLDFRHNGTILNVCHRCIV